MKKLTLIGLGLLATLSLSATALPIGGSATQPIGTVPTISPAITPLSQPFIGGSTLSVAYAVGGNTGTVRQAVSQLDSSTFDFYYQIVADSTSTATITNLLLRGFGGYMMDVTESFNNTPGAPFADASSSQSVFGVSRPTGAGTGANIGIQYPDGIGNPAPTTPNAKLVSSIITLRVKATGWTILSPLTNPPSGTIDSIILSQQVAPTPEPSFYAAVTLGLAGLFFVRRRKATVEADQA